MEIRASQSTTKYPTIPQAIPSGSLSRASGNPDKHWDSFIHKGLSAIQREYDIWNKSGYFGVFGAECFTPCFTHCFTL
jgi:hypothetical protein